MNNWISVEDELHPMDTTVLIGWIGEDIEPEKDFMSYDVELGLELWQNHTDEDEPTHWMLLPEPPK